ncbi:MAG: DNA polymerase III subunit epsilon [Chloroflexota bacterium]|nr:MAG: DNA polymerase III subunit epsilon [Chloroflexota bacterium]
MNDSLILKLANIGLVILGLVAAALIFNSATAGDWAIWLFLLVLGLILALGLGLNYLFQHYILAARRLVEEMRLILTANPAHRIQLTGPAEMRRLAEIANAYAERFQTLLADEDDKIRRARADLEEERNRLSVLMSELSEGVLACNMEGQILLYNSRARQLLSQPPGGHTLSGAGGFMGLGRSVFGLLDRHAITHALENLLYRSQKQSGPLVSQFVTTAANGQLIRARIALVLDQQHTLRGFILTLEDITRQFQTSSRRDILLQALTEGVRASLGSIRAAIETILEYPEMDQAKLHRFRQVIYDEALTLSARLNQATAEYAEDLKADWQLEEMLGDDLLWAIQRRFEDKLGVTTTLETVEENLWLKVDSYSVVQAMTYMMGRLKAELDIRHVTFRLKQSGRFAVLDMLWPDGSTEMEILWSWQNQALITEGEGTPLTLREVAERHGGEVWCQADRATNTTYFRLLLPTTQPKPVRSLQVSQESRPEYYDFDLFHQPGQKPELDQRPLAELTYTAFDTETTGLSPSAGDEIISIGAVRIVNGRLLRQEIFDQLVDPRRSVSRESINIHGISPDMLAGQPTIEQVLPLFRRFAEDTVLVGHNAAFDMRLLQLKEAQTGVKFINPVLDTLLLSAVIHPHQEGHSLEAIAARLGLNIIGRHTSLGDAILTGEIFLKLIPLLAERGIITLQDARNAAQETYYARLSY